MGAFWIGNDQCDNVAEKQAKKTIKKGKSPMWANFNCETFWYDGGDCDELNEAGGERADGRQATHFRSGPGGRRSCRCGARRREGAPQLLRRAVKSLASLCPAFLLALRE